MGKDEQKQIHPDYDKRDPLTLFMFGGKINDKAGQSEKSEELNMTNEIPLNPHDKIYFDDFLFGKREQEQSNKNINSWLEVYPQLSSLLNNVNVEELLENIDTIMNTASQIKPLWNKITPLVNKWMK